MSAQGQILPVRAKFCRSGPNSASQTQILPARGQNLLAEKSQSPVLQALTSKNEPVQRTFNGYGCRLRLTAQFLKRDGFKKAEAPLARSARLKI